MIQLAKFTGAVLILHIPPVITTESVTDIIHVQTFKRTSFHVLHQFRIFVSKDVPTCIRTYIHLPIIPISHSGSIVLYVSNF